MATHHDQATSIEAICDDIRRRVLPSFDGWHDAEVAPLGNGLINRTYLLSRAGGGKAVLQQVNPIFSPDIHLNIEAITARLDDAGLVTPRLVRPRDGQLCLQLDGGEVWRILTHVAGASFDVVASDDQARAAGALIARFHRALDGLDQTVTFVGLRQGVHDTARHLARMDEAVAAHPRHRLAAEVGPLIADLRAAAAALPALPELRPRVCHGDLKFNNVLFAGETGPSAARAVCLIDLDVVGPLSLAFELGDAWRSWCNRAGEDEPEAELDLGVFRASLDGYGAEIGRPLDEADRRGLLLGPEWISLELSSRFAADALAESYFGWNRARFAGRGEHNLVRARGQLSMHRALVATRAERAGMIARAFVVEG
jgi:Ser/Thr protein kinase RdoA (MazF antagonist)